MDRDFTSVILKSVVAIILLCAVAIPIITSIGPVPTEGADAVANGEIINTLISIIPVVLAVAIIIAIVYSVLIRNRD